MAKKPRKSQKSTNTPAGRQDIIRPGKKQREIMDKKGKGTGARKR